MNGSEGINSNWEEGVERQEESNKKEEQRIRKLEAKAIQNVNLYFIFQAVILASTTSTSSSSAKSSNCGNSWIPISLSLIAAITNFLTFFSFIKKILKSREQLDQAIADLAFIKSSNKVRTEQLHDQVLPGAADEILRPNGCSFKKWKRRFVVCLSVALFAAFSGVVVYGCHRILCHRGDSICVKLC